MWSLITFLWILQTSQAQEIIPDNRCPRSHPYAYRPSHDFDYCCATNVDNFGFVAWSNGGDPESCQNNQYVPCPVGTGCVDGEPGVTFIMEVRNPDITQDREKFGKSIAIEGNIMMVGTPNDNSARSGHGAVDVFSRDSADSEWVFQGEFYSPNEGTNEHFGYGVDFDGDLLVVGAVGNSDAEIGAGAAYAYERVNSEWVFQQQIIAPDAKEWDHFGWSVSLVGETLAIGASYDSDTGHSDSGSVYMYTRINSEWVFHSELFAPDAQPDDRFGRDVSIDGNLLAVGAYYNDDLGGNAGAVYLYELVNSVWVFQGKVHAPDGVDGDQFGVSVSMEGNMMAVGADQDDSGWRHDGGSMYLFKRENSEWVFQEEFFAPETEGGSQNFGRSFGYAVCFDGNKVVVGAPFAEEGAVLIYQMGDHMGGADLTGSTGCFEPEEGTPIQVNSIMMGKEYACVAVDDGRSKCWGKGDLGQLGFGDFQNRGDDEGEMGAHLEYTPWPSKIQYLGQTGTQYLDNTFALLDDGTVWGMGENRYGELCQGYTGAINSPVQVDTGSIDIKALVTGPNEGCVISTDDQLYCWGWNDEGRLGLGHRNNIGDGRGECGDNLQPVDLGTHEPILQFVAGSSSNCVIFTDHRMKCWGANYWGNLGHNDNNWRETRMGDDLPYTETGSFLPVAGSMTHRTTCILTIDGEVVCWGDMRWGAGGLPGRTDYTGYNANEMPERLEAIDFGSYNGAPRYATSLVSGRWHFCALLNDNNVVCWGHNEYGKGGRDPIEHENLGEREDQVGDNFVPVQFNQMVDENGDPVVNAADRYPVSINSGDFNTCAILDDGSVACWGKGANGALGQVSLQDQYIPVLINLEGSTICTGSSESSTADEVTETFSLGGASATLNGATVDVSVNQPGDSPQTKTLSGDSAWAFDTALEVGDEYTITVQSSSNYECSVVGGTGTISADTNDVEVTCLPLFTLGGSSALSGATGVIVSVDQPNSTPQSKTLVDDSQWTFDTKLLDGDVYTVSLGADPTGYTCALAGSTSATIASDINNLVVTCTPNSYSLGGTSTLDGATGVTVTVDQPSNTPQSIVLGADGAWTFDTELVHGDIFTVSIQEISGFTCSVSGTTSGTIQADTDGVEVTCEKICIAPQASTLDANAITVADSAQNLDGTFLLDVHWPSYLENVNLEFVTSSEVTSSNWYDTSRTGGWTLGNVDSCTKYFQQSFTFAQIDAVANVVTEGYDMKFDLHFTGTSSYVENGLQYTRGVGKTLTFTISLDQRVSATLDMNVNVAPSFFEATFETAVTNPDVFTDLEQNQDFLNDCTQALVDDGHDGIVCESVAPVQGSDAFIITFGGPEVNEMMALQSSLVATPLELNHVASPVAAASTEEIDSPVVAQADSVAMIQREPGEAFSRIEVQFTTVTRSPWSLSENAIEVIFEGNPLVEEPEILPVNSQARRILQEDVVEQEWKIVLKVQTSNVCAIAVHNFEIRFPSVYNGEQFSTTTGVTFSLAPDTAQCAVMQEVGSSPITAVLQIYSDEVAQWARADSNELQFIKFYLDETKRARVTLTNERPITSVSLANIVVTQEAVEKCTSCQNLAAFEYQCRTCDSGSTVLRSNDNTLEWQFKLDSDIFSGNVNSGTSTRIQFEFDVTYAQGAGRRLLYHMDVSERRNLQDSAYELPKNSKHGASFDMKDWDCKGNFGNGVFEQIIITSCPDGEQSLRVCTKQTSKNLDGTYTQVGYWKTEGKTCESPTPESEVPPEVQSDQVVAQSNDNTNLLYIVISGLSVALICGAVMFYQRSHPSDTPKILSETQKTVPLPATQGEMPTFSVASSEGDVTYLPNEWKDNVAICVNGMGEIQMMNHRQPDRSLHGQIME